MRTLFLAVLASTFVIAASAAELSEELAAACRSGDLAAARTLLQRGAKANEPNAENRLPLLLAISSRNAELVEMLLKSGADPNRSGGCTDRYCPTHPALPYAAFLDEPKLVRMLLAAKADISWGDHVATRRANVDGREEIYRILKQAGGREWASAPVRESRADRPKAAPVATTEKSIVLPAPAAPPAGAPVVKSVGERPRVAILADAGAEDASALLGAELSTRGWPLVERGEMQRVLDEQKLSGKEPVEATRAVAVGQLLGAEAVLMLRRQTLSGKTVLETRLARVTPGIIVDSAVEAWPLAAPAAWASGAVARLERSLARLRAPRGAAVALSAIRPSAGTPGAIAFARDVELLLRAELLRQPGVTLLERAELDTLEQERALTRGGDFWAGSFLLDGTAEPPLIQGGTATIRLRVQRLGGASEAAALVETGPPAGKLELVQRLATQALAAMRVESGTTTAPAAEAQQQLRRAEELYRTELHVEAYRAARTAALLGLDSSEARQWRMRTGIAAVTEQLAHMSNPSEFRFDHILMSGWGPEWLEWRLEGRPYLGPAELLETAIDFVHLWHEGYAAALAQSDETQIASWKALTNLVTGAAFAAQRSLDTVAGRDAYADALAGISRAVRDAYADLLARPGAIDPNRQDSFFQTYLDFLPAMHRTGDEIYHAYDALLEKYPPAAKEHSAVLVSLLRAREQLNALMIVEERSRRLTYTIPLREIASVRERLLPELTSSSSPLDRIAAAMLRYQRASAPADRRGSANELYALFRDHTAAFAEQPAALVLFNYAEETLNARDAGVWNRSPSQDGPAVLSPEMLALRRQLFLAVARVDPKVARSLYDSNYHPPGEDAAEIARLTARKPEPPRYPPMPDFSAAPPLVLQHAWDATSITPQSGMPFQVVLRSGIWTEDRLWMFGQSGWVEWQGEDYLVELSLPAFTARKTRIPVKSEFGAQHTLLLVDADYAIVGLPMKYLAVLDRKSNRWTVQTELSPAYKLLRHETKLYFINVSQGESGLVRYDLSSGAAERLASSRRVPALTPLDDPTIEAYNLALSPDANALVVTVAGAPRREKSQQAQSPYRPNVREMVLDFATGTWTTRPSAKSTGAGAGENRKLEYIGLSGPGYAAWNRPMGVNAFMLQAPDAEIPCAIFRLNFAVPPKTKIHSNNPDALPLGDWFWTPHGYLMSESFSGASDLWLIPAAELQKYLRAHRPEMKPMPFPVAPMKYADAPAQK